MASDPAGRAAAVSEQARANRAYVRALLKRKQPEFAGLLELIELEFCAGELMAGAARG